MEGYIAKWYVKTTQKNMEQYKTWANEVKDNKCADPKPQCGLSHRISLEPSEPHAGDLFDAAPTTPALTMH